MNFTKSWQLHCVAIIVPLWFCCLVQTIIDQAITKTMYERTSQAPRVWDSIWWSKIVCQFSSAPHDINFMNFHGFMMIQFLQFKSPFQYKCIYIFYSSIFDHIYLITAVNLMYMLKWCTVGKRNQQWLLKERSSPWFITLFLHLQVVLLCWALDR